MDIFLDICSLINDHTSSVTDNPKIDITHEFIDPRRYVNLKNIQFFAMQK